MGDDWIKLLNSTEALQMDIIMGMLQSQGLRVVRLNQQDSAYLSYGSINIYVHRDDYMKAKFLIENPAQDERPDS